MNRQRSISDEFGLRVRRVLDQGTAELPDRTVQRLSAARSMALGRHRDADPMLVLAPAHTRSSGGVLAHAPMRGGFAFAMSVLVLAGGLFAINEWQQSNRVAELVEIDSQILADDLPIDAAADPGFIHFLRNER